MKKRRIIIIGGPTASGKSTLALQLAQRLRGIIINADSMQVYKGLPSLTACPTVSDYQKAPHFLYEQESPLYPYSVVQWAEAAAKIIHQHPITSVIIVGGTGFYLKTLLEGIAEIPSIPEEIRLYVSQEWAQKGPSLLYHQLQQVDPEIVTLLKPTDRQRLCRAWEVFYYTKKSLSDWHRQPKRQFFSDEVEIIVIDPEKNWLYPIINQRVLSMVNQGIFEEIKLFPQNYPKPAQPLIGVLGFTEFSAYLHQQLSLQQAIEKTQQRTRQYAKRQATWFRHQLKKAYFIQPSQIDNWLKQFAK